MVPCKIHCLFSFSWLNIIVCSFVRCVSDWYIIVVSAIFRLVSYSITFCSLFCILLGFVSYWFFVVSFFDFYCILLDIIWQWSV